MRHLKVSSKIKSLLDKKIETKQTSPLIYDTIFLLNLPQNKVDIFRKKKLFTTNKLDTMRMEVLSMGV